MAAVKGLFRRILRHFSRSSDCPGVERQFSEPSSTHTCECSRGPAQFHAQSMWTHTFRLKVRVKNNNNHNNNQAFDPRLPLCVISCQTLAVDRRRRERRLRSWLKHERQTVRMPRPSTTPQHRFRRS